MSVLAVQAGPSTTLANGVVDTGQRAVLSVIRGEAGVSSYTLFGNSLYMIWYDVGILNTQQSFSFFCKQYYNKPMQWIELVAPPPNPLIGGSGIYLIPRPEPAPPIASGVLTLTDAGYDPLKGFYLTFLGNYYLTCPLLRGLSSIVSVIPDYRNGVPQ